MRKLDDLASGALQARADALVEQIQEARLESSDPRLDDLAHRAEVLRLGAALRSPSGRVVERSSTAIVDYLRTVPLWAWAVIPAILLQIALVTASIDAVDSGRPDAKAAMRSAVCSIAIGVAALALLVPFARGRLPACVGGIALLLGFLAGGDARLHIMNGLEDVGLPFRTPADYDYDWHVFYLFLPLVAAGLFASLFLMERWTTVGASVRVAPLAMLIAFNLTYAQIIASSATEMATAAAEAFERNYVPRTLPWGGALSISALALAAIARSRAMKQRSMASSA